MANKVKDEKRNNTFEREQSHTIEYYFSDEELKQKSRELASAIQDKDEIESRKKEVMSEFKNKIDSKAADISMLSNHISNGYHMRTVRCRVVFRPDDCKKEYWYDGKLYDTQKMTAEDYQTKLEIREHE